MDFNQINTIVMDVDGTLTDGYYHVREDGKVSKSFYTKDFYAMEKALSEDIKILIITQSSGKVIKKKIENLGMCKAFCWSEYIMNKDLTIISDSQYKVKSIDLYLQGGVCCGWENIVYLGDAENDLECMKKAYYTACPFDAIEIIKENSNYISNYDGGKGFVYDFINYFLGKIGVKNENSGT